ncbi:flocculation protein FLO11-like [Sorghum bicolor]|uniref:flocculation protein FLO11-like n=1 Tax=Sorghum bicolor TaxID=4558 RepID=UPI000B424C57|nr:flocculation protein FLO11-like [Sorghum bicolor]|eukprot:XP_021321722.1 flocculation protein FLO11-like [Sorghum bicolor]
MISSFVSAASNVHPGNVAGQRMAEPTVVVENAAEQTTQEPTEEQPTVVTATETTEEDPAPARTGASTLTMDDEAARTPPPSSVAEEGDRAPTPPPAEETRAPTLARAEASSPKGSPSRGKDPLIPVTMAGGSTEGEEAQATSDDEVEEI